MLAHKQFTVPQLVEFGVAAEHAGFDFVATSDHLLPRPANEGHAGPTWVALSALGQGTRRILMGTTVTCPTLRYNSGRGVSSTSTAKKYSHACAVQNRERKSVNAEGVDAKMPRKEENV